MFAVLQVADFSLQAVLRIERDLADRAVALLDETGRPPVVMACTVAAAEAGVECGLTSPQAMARCAGVLLRSANPIAEAEARAGLLAAALMVAPQVEDTAPGVCTIQVSALPDERREAALLAALDQLERLGLAATAGLAPTPLLARYAAGAGKRPPARQLTFVAEAGEAISPGTAPQRASRTSPNDPRCVRLDPPQVRGFLQDLPLSVAEPTPEIAGILGGWGIRTLGELTELTKADVTQRLGPQGLALWERAAGETTRPLRSISPPQTFMAEMDLEQEVETLEPLLFLLRRFIGRLALELRAAGLVADEMRLALKLADDAVHRHEFRLPEPTAQEEILFRVLHTHLEALHTTTAIQGVALACRPVRPLARQHGLFDSALRDPHGFAETLARVGAIVGPERVGTPVLENTHRADAVRIEPPPSVVPPAAGAVEQPPRGPPLRRYRPPVNATVELQGQAPAFVWTAKRAGAVRALAGPWRASGDWWDAGRAWRREEWDVELETGGVYRLLHLPEGWFVEGEYD